jgi:hypothetical protein
LWRNIGPLCAPFLTLDVTHAQMPAVRRWLFVFPEAGEEFCDWLVDAPGSDWERSLTLTHPHWALLLTLQDHAECQRLRAWSVWSEEGGG